MKLVFLILLRDSCELYNIFIGMHFVSQSVRPSVTFRVRSITNVSIDGLPSILVQMLSSLRRCAVTLTQIHTSKVKVIHMLVSAL